MPEFIVLAKVRVLAESLAAHPRPNLRSRERSHRQSGSLGQTVWAHANHEDCGLAIYRYSDYKSAQAALEHIVDGEFAAEAIEGTATPHIVEAQVVHREGATFDETEIGSYLSISERYAAPGHGPDLDEDLARVFAELRLGQGFSGSLRGYKVGLEEDRLGIVLWETKEAFEATLPTMPIYEVQLYRRVL